MLKIIERMWVRPIEDMPNTDWIEVSFVPATAVLNIEDVVEDAGRLRTYKISAKVPKRLPIFSRNLVVKMLWDNNLISSMGSIDMPVRFDVSETDTIVISAKYQCRADYYAAPSF